MTRFWIIAASALLLTGCRMFSTVRLEHDFERDPQASGWTYTKPKEDAPPKGSWVGDVSSPEAHSIVATAGHWHSPAFEVEPFQYYKITFQSKAEGKAYWAAKFYYADGNALAADHYSSVGASKSWIDNEFCFRGKANAVTAIICFQPRGSKALAIRKVKVRTLRRKKVAAWADSVRATIPPVLYAPPSYRWECIPRTIKKLNSGKTVRIVLLGDSIANDVGNSPFDALLERIYPGANVEVISSVRSSTGCRYYREENRVKEYVVDLKPDLLIIAGISNGHDPEAMRSVIRQVREQIDTEIMVTTGAVAPRRRKVRKKTSTFALRVEAMCYEENAEFLDMRLAWDQYIENCGVHDETFRRDSIHANAQGSQVLAAILARYFGPDKWDSSTAKAFSVITETLGKGLSGGYNGGMHFFMPSLWP